MVAVAAAAAAAAAVVYVASAPDLRGSPIPHARCLVAEVMIIISMSVLL